MKNHELLRRVGIYKAWALWNLALEREGTAVRITRSNSSCIVYKAVPWAHILEIVRTMENCNPSALKVPLLDHAETNEELGHLADSSDSAAAAEVEASALASASTKSGHPLGFGALVFLIYYNIGVPFGDEGVRTQTYTTAICSLSP